MKNIIKDMVFPFLFFRVHVPLYGNVAELQRQGKNTLGREHWVKFRVHTVKMLIPVLHGSRIRAFTELSSEIRESRAVGRKRNVSGKGILLSKGLPERCILRWLAKEA